MTRREVQAALRELGWPILVNGQDTAQTRQAVYDFQRGNAWEQLAIDGIAGPKTQAALAASLERGGKCGRWFVFREFASKGDGWIKVRRELVTGLDRCRDAVGPLRIQSGYRDPNHNRRVGGATSSQHLHGNAADVEPDLNYGLVTGLHAFSGVGVVRAGRVAHVDVRHLGPNTTGGSPARPTVWYYG